MPVPAPDPVAQLALDWLIPFRASKQLLNTEETAKVLDVGQDVIRGLVDQGELHAHRFNALGATDRKTNRVTRESVRLYLVKTANYDDDARVNTVLHVASTFSDSMRAALITALQRQQKRH